MMTIPHTLLPRIAALIFNRPLAIYPARLDVIVGVFDRKVGFVDGDWQVDVEPDAAPSYEVIDGTAVIPIFGELVNRTYGLNAMSGLASYPELGALHAQALSDADVRDILLLIQSPGGDVHGLFDLADQIAAARRQKPIAALASDYALSAAYVLAAATGNVFVTQSAQVGSNGVVMEIQDRSGADAAAGVKRRKLYAGARKIDGSSHAPQTDAAIAALQAEVDTYYDLLTTKVAGYLGTTQEAIQATEAGIYIGAQAIQQGLAHGMSTYEGMLTRTTPQVHTITSLTASNAQAGHNLPALAGATKETAMEITTTEALAKAYPDLCQQIEDKAFESAASREQEKKTQLMAEATKAEQDRIKEILGLAGYALPKLVATALFENGGLTGDKAARLFLEQRYERTAATASAFLTDAIPPAQVQPLSDAPQLTHEQAMVNKQMGLDQGTFIKFAHVGLADPTRD